MTRSRTDSLWRIFACVWRSYSGGYEPPPLAVGLIVAHVEEILIEILNLQRGTSLVDRCLRKREQERGEETQESNQNQRAFVTPEDIQIFEQQAGAGLLDDGRGWHFDVLRARQQIALAILSSLRVRGGSFQERSVFHGILINGRSQRKRRRTPPREQSRS